MKPTSPRRKIQRPREWQVWTEPGGSHGHISGFSSSEYPTQSGANGTAPAATLGDVLRRGYMSVRLASGTAVHNGQAYVRLVAASGKAVGDIEAAADGDNSLSIAGCVFTGPADASGITEIAYNL